MRLRTRPRPDTTRSRPRPKNLALRPCWPQGLNIPANYRGLLLGDGHVSEKLAQNDSAKAGSRNATASPTP